jgi:RNA polymerase sigma-70 factor, ECF subfamily
MTPDDAADLPWQSVEQFYRAASKQLLVSLCYLLRSTQDAEDVLQEAFIRVANNWPTLGVESRARTCAWLKTTAGRLGLNCIRKRKRQREVALDEVLGEHLNADQVTPEQAYEEIDAARAALVALDSLSDRQRKVYLLKHYFGFDMKEIAEELECAESTARVQLSRAQQSINRKLTGSEPSVIRNGKAEFGVES